MNNQLENKRALVTGGSRGIGAALVAWLAGAESSYVTGASLSIDGGYTA